MSKASANYTNRYPQLQMPISLNKYPEVKQVIEILINNYNSTRVIIQKFGTEDTNTKRDSRGSLFLKPYSKSFNTIAINPDLSPNEDGEIQHFSISFANSQIEIKDLIQLDNNYKVGYIHYDDEYIISVKPNSLDPISSIETSLGSNKEVNNKTTNKLTFKFKK